MADSLEAHAVSYAHELEAMVRQKNAEIARLRTQLREQHEVAEMIRQTQMGALLSEQMRLQAETEQLRNAYDAVVNMHQGCIAESKRDDEEIARLQGDYERMWSALQAETTTSVQVRGELRTEIDRLRAALQWVMNVSPEGSRVYDEVHAALGSAKPKKEG